MAPLTLAITVGLIALLAGLLWGAWLRMLATDGTPHSNSTGGDVALMVFGVVALVFAVVFGLVGLFTLAGAVS